MDEFALINDFFARATAPRADVLVGIGDDGAVTRIPGAQSALVLVTDTIVAGVHFPPAVAAASIGHRVLAVNLSDIAAMGAEPAWALLALSLPGAEAPWLEAFASGLGALAAVHGVTLVGGDTTRGPVVSATVTLAGLICPRQILRRNGAAPGDVVCVTGTPGDAAAGLALLQEAGGAAEMAPAGEGSDVARLQDRFLHPSARVCCGRRLRGRASAAIDLSDGLLADAGKLAEASGVRLEIALERLPCSDPLLAYTGDRQRAEMLALTGGDDYELLVTVPGDEVEALLGLCGICGAALTPIGRVISPDARKRPGVTALRAGVALDIDVSGYRHFT